MTSIENDEFLVKPNQAVRLADFETGSTGKFKSKNHAQAKLRAEIERLSVLQEMLYANGEYALLLILQGMDTAGKDGIIKHVMSGVNPQGVDVSSFKAPSAEELAHDYLWRCVKALPERGRIGIFNRSYYEELVVVRVHQTILEHEQLPPALTVDLWRNRHEDILAFERHLSRNGVRIVKCFLHISEEEQRKRLLERIDVPEKNWKLSAADVQERKFWDRYHHAYEEMLTRTSATFAPWYVIPADHKWYARIAVANIVLAELEALHLTYPSISDEQRAHLATIRETLAAPDEQKREQEEATKTEAKTED